MSRTFALATASGLRSKRNRKADRIQVIQGSWAQERQIQTIATNIHTFLLSRRHLHEDEPRLRRIHT